MVEVKEKIKTKTKTKAKTKTLDAKERQTIVHCTYNPEAAVRVWPSTFLVEKETGRRARLITAYNISFAPEWTFATNGNRFTLIFEGLSKGCASFDLVEDIPLPDPFIVKDIPRNKTDVYNVKIS